MQYRLPLTIGYTPRTGLVRFALMVFLPILLYSTTYADSAHKIQRCWQYPASGEPQTAVHANVERILIKLDGGVLKALRTTDGTEEWTAELGGEIVSDVASAGEKYFFVTRSIPLNGTGEASAYLRSVSSETGLPGTSVKIASTEAATVLAVGEMVIVIGADGTLSGFDANGLKIWNFSVSGAVSAAPIFGSQSFTIGTSEKAVYTIAVATGGTLNRIPGETTPTSVALGGDGVLFVGDDRGRIHNVDTASGSVKWTFKSGGRVERLTADRGSVVAVSVDNFLYSIDGSSGRVEWKRRLAGRMIGSPVANDSFLVAVTNSSAQVLFLHPKNGSTLETLTLEGDERPVSPALLAADATVILTTTNGIAAYRFGQCQSEKAMS